MTLNDIVANWFFFSFSVFFPSLLLWIYNFSSYVLFRYVPQKKWKKDKNGLIISWQIPTSSLENGTIFLPSFFQYECTEKDFRTAQDPVLQSFKLEFCIILIQLGEKTAKKTTTHTHTHTNTHHIKKNKRNLKRSFRFEKICSGFVYCIYEYVFEN